MEEVTNCPGQPLFAERFTKSVSMLQMIQVTEYLI